VSTNVVAFLADSLALWKVEGAVEAGAQPEDAVIRAGKCVVCIEHNADDDKPWRWFVRWRSGDIGEERSRPCAALTGMLNAVRRALDVERGNAVKISPAPSA
jgi:hypothetical protein